MLKQITLKGQRDRGNDRTVNMRIVNALIHIHVRSIHMVMFPEQAVSSDHACSAQMLSY